MVTPLLQAPLAAPVKKPIVLKKIVAHSVKVRTERELVGGEPQLGAGSVINKCCLHRSHPSTRREGALG